MLELAALANVAINITGACTLSYQPFLYVDITVPLARIIDAYGIDAACEATIGLATRC